MNSHPVAVTIYHNPGCGTSRNTLALTRNANVEPTIIEYLTTPPDRATLQSKPTRRTRFAAGTTSQPSHPLLYQLIPTFLLG